MDCVKTNMDTTGTIRETVALRDSADTSMVKAPHARVYSTIISIIQRAVTRTLGK